MIQLILHLIGDYLIQNDWMALNKKKIGWRGFWICQIHCITYALPFLLIGSYDAILVIMVTHYILDRYYIVEWFIAIKNGVFHINNFGYKHERPIFITAWLCIIVDNTLHIIINYLALKYM